jgi:hypothetical protein
MKYEKIDSPTFAIDDICKIVKYSDFVVELTQIHYNVKPIYDPEKKNEYKPMKFYTQYSLSKELKKAREKILTNILPDDLEYSHFLTLTRKGLDSPSDAKKAWDEFKNTFEEKYGKFKYFVFYEHSANDGYHIHSLVWDSQHQDKFKYIKYKYFDSIWDGNLKCQKPKDFDGLIRISYYLTKKEKYSGKIPKNCLLWESSEDIIDSPKPHDYTSGELDNMKELCSNSYRLYDKNNTIDVIIKRTMYIAESVLKEAV